MILGAILAGGRARRFGADKALALLKGRPLIAHVAAALAAQVDALVICGREWGGLAMIPDRPAPNLGPLGGLAAALRHATLNGYEAVLTAGCDTPRLPADLFARMGPPPGPAYLDALPVIGLWPATLSGPLDAHLAAGGDRSLRRWARIAGARDVALGIDIANINTPADLAGLAEFGPL